MLLPVVLRLVKSPLRAGQLAGELEWVDTGERLAFRSAEELVQLCQRHLADAPDDALVAAGLEQTVEGEMS